MRETTTAILDELLRVAARDEADGARFAVGDVTEAFGARAFGPFLIVLPLIEMSPLGFMFFVPSFLALLIATVAVQMAIGRRCLWLPGFIQRRSVKAHRITKGAPKLRRVTRFIDRHTSERWHHLTGGVPRRAAALTIVVLCLPVPALEFVPGASTVPMAAVLAFGTAILAKDGRLMATAFALSGLAVGVVGYLAFTKLLT